MKPKIIIAVLVAVVLVAGGAFAYTTFLAPSEDDAVTLVPEDAFFYANVFLDPSTDQKQAIEALLTKFPDAGTPEEAAKEIEKLLDQALAELDLDWEDVEPWLGKQMAVFLTAPEKKDGDFDGAGLLHTEDPEAALQSIDKALESVEDIKRSEESYKGFDYTRGESTEEFGSETPAAVGVVEGFVVIGTESGFKDVVDAQEGESLEESERFADAMDRLTEDRLASFFFDGEKLKDYLEAEEVPMSMMGSQGIFGFGLTQLTTGAIYAQPDGLVLEQFSNLPDEGPFAEYMSKAGDASLIPELPAGSWGAFGLPDVGELVNIVIDEFGSMEMMGFDREQMEQAFAQETGLDLQQDLLSWMGDIGLFVEGSDLSTIEGGLVLESTDPETSQRSLEKLIALAKKEQAPIKDGPNGTYSIQEPGMPKPVFLSIRGDRLVATYGQNALDNAREGEDLPENEMFDRASRALGEGFSVNMYFDIDEAREFFEGIVPDHDPIYTDRVRPNLEPLAFLVSGSRVDGDGIVQKMIIGVDE